jgi:hypothetical protein
VFVRLCGHASLWPCVSVAVLLLPDKDLSVSVFHVTTSPRLRATATQGDQRSKGAQLGVALCCGNASLGRSGLYNLTTVSGRAPLRGLSCPSAAVV